MNAFWPVREGVFCPFPFDIHCISDETHHFIEEVRALQFHDPLFIRGSMVESSRPFHLSDIDLIVILRTEDAHKRYHQLVELSHRSLDIKWLSDIDIEEDLVQRALITHRAFQIAGPPISLDPIPTDFDFAWAHWRTYFPSGIPRQLSTQDPFCLIFFKLIMRCFGVLSFLQSPDRFTRDIDSCMQIAEDFNLPEIEALRQFRRALEEQKEACINIRNVIRFVQLEFDK